MRCRFGAPMASRICTAQNDNMSSHQAKRPTCRLAWSGDQTRSASDRAPGSLWRPTAAGFVWGTTLNELATYLAAFMCPKLAKALPMKAASFAARYAASLSQRDPHPMNPGCAVVSNVVCFPTPHPQRLKKEGWVWGLEKSEFEPIWEGSRGWGSGEKRSDFDSVDGVEAGVKRKRRSV